MTGAVAPCRRGEPASVIPAPTWLRTPVFVVATLLLSVVAHLAGGGAPPDPVVVLMLAVLVAAGCPTAGRRECSLPRVIAGVVAVQAVSHLVFGSAMAAHPSCAMLPGAAMWATHGGAAVLLALWLRRGEAAAWAAARRAGSMLVRLLAPSTADPTGEPAVRPATRAAEAALPRRSAVPAAVGRRGPPGPQPL